MSHIILGHVLNLAFCDWLALNCALSAFLNWQMGKQQALIQSLVWTGLSMYFIPLYCFLCVIVIIAGLLEQPVVLEEGLKREKKKVLRLEITSPTPSKDKKLDIPEGSGEKLGDIPRIEFQLGKTLSDDLRPLHRLLFQRAGSVWLSFC